MQQNICPVDVIAMHSANGDIHPLRFAWRMSSISYCELILKKLSAAKEFCM